jgi:ferric-dicitrate binding protein FerR (iron transport regulator)
MAAATIILVLVAIYFIYSNKQSNRNGDQPIASSDSILPGGNRAVLTLADGTVIDLDNQEIGWALNTGNSHVVKPADGELVYDQNNTGFGSVSFHILSTPVGGQYQLVLPDGSKVWLNATSSIKYPVRFPANERRVEVEGEAYFEVRKNQQAPFIVMLPDSTDVRVLGTHFNVMSYNNEGQKQITLLEGSVAVTKNKAQLVLKPGMQAIVTNNAIEKKVDVDTSEVTGWKNGLFVFHDAPIELIMRQVERWYGANVVYKGKISQQFNATIYRKEQLSKLLHLLELNGYVHFQIQNKTIYVLP